MTKYIFCHVTHIPRASENLSHFAIIYATLPDKKFHSCIENVKIFSSVTTNMCHVTKDVFRTALLLLRKFSRIVLLTIVILYPQIFVPFFWSTALYQVNTAVAVSASAAAGPGSSPWLCPAMLAEILSFYD